MNERMNDHMLNWMNVRLYEYMNELPTTGTSDWASGLAHEWVNEVTDDCTNARMHARVAERLYVWTNACMPNRMNECMHNWPGERMREWVTDRPSDEWPSDRVTEWPSNQKLVKMYGPPQQQCKKLKCKKCNFKLSLTWMLIVSFSYCVFINWF